MIRERFNVSKRLATVVNDKIELERLQECDSYEGCMVELAELYLKESNEDYSAIDFSNIHKICHCLCIPNFKVDNFNPKRIAIANNTVSKLKRDSSMVDTVLNEFVQAYRSGNSVVQI